MSPASTWKSFANLNVTINTNYYLTDASEGFEQIEGGYAWHSDTLPSNELQFSLCKSRSPQKRGYAAGNAIVSIILLTLLEPLCIVVVGLVIVVVVIKKKEKSAKYAEPRSKSKRNGKNENKADFRSVGNEQNPCEQYQGEPRDNDPSGEPTASVNDEQNVLEAYKKNKSASAERNEKANASENIDLSGDNEENGANDDTSK